MSLDNVKIHILSGEITWDLAGQVLADLMQANLKGYTTAEGVTTGPIKKFVIPILSHGGDTDAAWSIHAALKNLDAEVVTIAAGRVYSAALIPYMAGQQRLSFKESIFLFHPATITNIHNEEKTMQKLSEEVAGERLDRAIFKNLLKEVCPTISKKIIFKLTHESKSVFVDAEQAKEYGLVTHIINQLTEIEDIDHNVLTQRELADRATVVNPQKLLR